MKGRKPEIHALLGALDKAPPAPAWLPKFAKTEWARVVPALVKARSLALHELSTVESYCIAVARIRECERAGAIESRSAAMSGMVAPFHKLAPARAVSPMVVRVCRQLPGQASPLQRPGRSNGDQRR
jgi:phage terminase small subunit